MYIHKLILPSQDFLNDKVLSQCYSVIIIGTVIKQDITIVDSEEVFVDKIVDGWHVDLLSDHIINEVREYCLESKPLNFYHLNNWAGKLKKLVLKTDVTDL